MPKGFIIAAPHSGSGKTTITLGLLRYLTNEGLAVASAKAGPDFIDPQYHAAATRADCVNLDPWAMRSDLIMRLANAIEKPLIVEAMMGLFDGAADGSGSAADLALMLGVPVVLVVDAAKQSHSIAALVHGFSSFRGDVKIAGVILNKVGSPRHEEMMREALRAIEIPVLGVVYRDDALVLPERHLGLLQAQELPQLEAFLDGAAQVVGASLDIEALMALERSQVDSDAVNRMKPLGQNIAVAQDAAFSFCYPHLLAGWQEQGASLSLFSPLANEAPIDACDAIYLPGGYPELHGGKLAEKTIFLEGLRDGANRGAFVYGECGGYMVLGEELVDKQGKRHAMSGLLPLVTSFAARKLSLGYRMAQALTDLPFAQSGQYLTSHEFHYSTVERSGDCDALFSIEDARGQSLGTCGMRRANVAGSYMHLIDEKA